METADFCQRRPSPRASRRAAIFMAAAGLLIAGELLSEQWLLPEAAAAAAVDQLQMDDAPAERLRMIGQLRQWLPAGMAVLIMATGAVVFGAGPLRLSGPRRWRVWLRRRVRRWRRRR